MIGRLLLSIAALAVPALAFGQDDPRERIAALQEQFDEAFDDGRMADAQRRAGAMETLAKAHGDDRLLVTWGLEARGRLALFFGRYDESARLFEQSGKIVLEELGEDEDFAANRLLLAEVRTAQGRLAEARALAEKAREIVEENYGRRDAQMAFVLAQLSQIAAEQDRYADALRHIREAIEIAAAEIGEEAYILPAYHEAHAGLLADLDRLAEAEALLDKALALRQQIMGEDHPDLAYTWWSLADLRTKQERYAEADELYAKAIERFAATYGENSPDALACSESRADALMALGRFAEAERLGRQTLQATEKLFGPLSPRVAKSLCGLATSFSEQGRFAEAQAFLQRALAIERRVFGDNSITAYTSQMLAMALLWQGKYGEAEDLCRQSFAYLEKTLGPDHSWTAEAAENLANVYWEQTRFDEALPLYERALAVREKTRGDDNPSVVVACVNVASTCAETGDFAKAGPLFDRAIALAEKRAGGGVDRTGRLALAIYYRARMFVAQGKHDLAQRDLQRAIELMKSSHGEAHPDLGMGMRLLAEAQLGQGRPEEAERLLDEAIALMERSGAYPTERFGAYEMRASLAWADGRRSEAQADLRQAMQLAESQRGHSGGAERERAKFFVRFASAYETMVAWQTELGDVSEALRTMEQARARSLLDELMLPGADLELGLSSQERDALRAREAELKQQVASLEARLGAAAPEARRALEAELQTARESLYRHYRDARQRNPIYRSLLGGAGEPPRLTQIRRELTRQDGLLLAYLAGEKGTYLAHLDGEGAGVTALAIAPSEAEALGVAAGPLTAGLMREILLGKQGLLSQLSDAENAAKTTSKLAALWRVLAPETVRRQLTAGNLKRAIVVPDGPLALLPFETLVVEEGPIGEGTEPVYLLDVGPPISYGPSAAVLMNIEQRPQNEVAAGAAPKEAAIAVGDPAYPAATASSHSAATHSATRYSALGGRLTALPFSGTEAKWVTSVFQKQGIGAVQLTKQNATEANVRRQVAGRKYVHLACHGLADQRFGNFFGALALTPGAAPSGATKDKLALSQDDGFLMLPEIYELDLKRCELAILSACSTNFGPEQAGEGVWALSRGFLVAGSRRVVASNWLVDDEAAASLISYFCAGVAQNEKRGADPAYAQKLSDAKKWVRQQGKWSSPYYWGTFVLVGAD